MADTEVVIDVAELVGHATEHALAGSEISAVAPEDALVGPSDEGLDELLREAADFAPLPASARGSTVASGDVSSDEEDCIPKNLGVTTLEDRSSQPTPRPTGHMAVVDRLYKWNERRSAKLVRARREEKHRIGHEEREQCTFRPAVGKSVSQLLRTGRVGRFPPPYEQRRSR